MSGGWSPPDGGGLVPSSIEGPLDRYRAALGRVAGGQVEAVYAVGAIALGDWSERQSNVDLVVVATPPLGVGQRAQLAGFEKVLERSGRRPEIWYTTWERIAGAPATAPTTTPPGLAPPGLAPPTAAPPTDAPPTGAPDSPSTPAPGRPPSPEPEHPLATPLTLGILRQDPVAVDGPDWPVVGFEAEALRVWARARLRSLVESSHGLLVMRRAVVPVVLEAARLAQAVTTGRVMSKSAAGEAVIPLVATPHRRILTDSVGYRRGAQTSMYWGPFERKYDALALLRDLLDLASRPAPSGP